MAISFISPIIILDRKLNSVCVCLFSSGNGDLQLLFVLSISREASERLKAVSNDPHRPFLANTITLTHTFTHSLSSISPSRQSLILSWCISRR